MKRIKCLIIVCFTLCCFTFVCEAQQEEKKDPQDYIKEAELFAEKKNYEEAIKLATKAADNYRENLGEDNIDYARALHYLSTYYYEISNYTDAISIETKAAEIRRAKLGEKNKDYLASLSNLATYNSDLGNYQEAIRLSTQVVEISRDALGDKSLDYAASLSDLAYYHDKLGNYQEAIKFVTQAAEIQREVLGEESPDYATSLNNLALNNAYLLNYQEAIKLGTKALKIQREVLGEKHQDYAESLGNIAWYNGELGNYQESIRLGAQSAEIQREISGEKSLDYAESLSFIAKYNANLGNYHEAINLGTQAAEIKGEILGKEHPDYAVSLNNLASFKAILNLPIDSLIAKADEAYYVESNDTLAVKYIKIALNNISRDGNNQKGYTYAKLKALLCNYGADEDSERAIENGEEALNILKAAPDKVAFGDCLSSLSYCYSISDQDSNQESNSQKSIKYCTEAIQIFRREKSDLNLCQALSHLAGCYIAKGDYIKAIDIANESIAFADSCQGILEDKLPGKNNIDLIKWADGYSLALHNKAMALYYIGRYQESLSISKTNLQLRLKTWGFKGRYSISAYNLAILETELGHYDDALKHMTDSYNIEIANGDHIDAAISRLCHIIDILLSKGELFKARPNYGMLTNMLESIENIKESSIYSEFLNIAVKYWLHVGDYQQAYEYLYESEAYNNGCCIDDDIHIQMLLHEGSDSLAYQRATKTQTFYENTYGKSHMTSIANISNLVKTAFALGKWAQADSCAIEYVYGMKNQMKTMFPSMTSEDRELFVKKYHNTLFQYMPSFFDSTRRNGFAKTMYDLTLLHKGLLLRSEQELSTLVKQSNNQEALKLHNDISNIIGQIKNANDGFEQDSLSYIILQRQKRLQELIPDFAKSSNHFDISWNDVKDNLQQGEVAIEFVDIINHNTGNKSCKALIITPNCEQPYYIDLFNETDLLNIKKEDFYTTDFLFALIWDPIEARLLQYDKSIDKIYFSSSNLISQIAVENLLDYWGHRVSEKRTYYRLSSTREIVNRYLSSSLKSAVVYGGLKYDANEDDLVMVNSNFSVSTQSRGLSSVERMENFKDARAGVQYLPATRIEAQKIDSELKNKGINSLLLEDVNGTEESFLSLPQSKPNILHIATHGFYWTKTDADSILSKRAINTSLLGLQAMTQEDKALTRSGLLLSGVNVALKGENIDSHLHDGILTALEISKLDLSSLNLAVLSACETGLGDIKSGEGIIGLQRGFKKAGAKSLLMSLWKVDDIATQMLMVEFYKNFLNNKSKTKSLQAAQNYVMNQYGYEDPEYWAGFVLLDALD